MSNELNLADSAVRKRLAAQWGFVPASATSPRLQRTVTRLQKQIRDLKGSVEYWQGLAQRQVQHSGPEAAASAPVVQGEPVAWLYDWRAVGAIVRDWLTQSREEAHNERVGCHNIRPLYAAPAAPARQPLTDEQMLEALDDVPMAARAACGYPSYTDMMKIARAIERAHGVGQEGGAA